MVILPIVVGLGYWLIRIWWPGYIRRLQKRSWRKREVILKELGVKDVSKAKVVGYFHPYCNLGGGGERVLWAAIQFMQNTEPDVVNIIYTGDVDATKEQIINKAKTAWDITLQPETLHFIYLKRRKWVEDSTWRRFTLIGQSLGSMYLAWEAMGALMPDLYIDTMGYAFTYHVVSWLTRSPTQPPIPIGTYTHYPTISCTMINRVQTRTSSTTNSSAITRSSFLSSLKLIYLRLFAYYYTLSLRRAQYVMVNSSWTRGHVDDVLTEKGDGWIGWVHRYIPPLIAVKFLLRNGEWGGKRPSAKRSSIVYPPCETKAMQKFSLKGREKVILSLAQFRPEKDQATQIRALHEFTTKHPEIRNVKLVQIGGARPSDLGRIEDLKKLANDLGLKDKVEFIVSAPYSEIIGWLSKSSIGISTMIDEHFGINIVEYLAAGLIPVTHASGGPFLDIAIPVSGGPTGFHCTSVSEYADAFYRVFTMEPAADEAMRTRGRKWATNAFSTRGFENGWAASGWKKWLEVGVRTREERK